MTLTQYLRVLRQHWLIVLILTLLGVTAAIAYTSRQTPLYQAQTQVFVSAQNPASDSTLTQLSESSTFSQQRVKSYANMATSSAVTMPVVKELRLPYTPAELGGKIDASPQLDTVLINISVTDPVPATAAAIAAAVTTHLQSVVDDLEKNNARGRSPVMLTVTRPPTVPTAPVSPRVPLNIALGLLLGLGLGIGAAVLRDQLNTTVRGAGEVEQLTGSVPLGVVPFDASAPKKPLVTADAFGGRAEAFRTLRTNLQFADVDHPPRVIAVTSALPEEGKTTTACNIALILAQSGARVVLVEGDLRKPAVGKYLGISNAVGLTNVLAGQHDLRDVVVGYERDLLAVLPSGPTPPNPSELLGSQQMRILLDTLAQHYDVVVIDAPPLLPVTDAALIATAADGAILVIRHGRSRREETERALKSLEAVSAKVLGSVLNFAPRRKGRNGYQGYGYGYGQPPVTPEVPAASEPEGKPSRSRRGRKPEPVAPAIEEVPPTSIALPDTDAASLPLEPLTSENWGGPTSAFELGMPDSPNVDPRTILPGTGGGQASFDAAPKTPAQPPTPGRSWAPDMGWAPSPSDGWAPIADSPGRPASAPESSFDGGISVFGGLSSTGPLPVVTDPGTDGLAVVSRTDGLEIIRTTEDVSAQMVRPREPEVDRLEVEHRPVGRASRALSAEEVPEALRLQPLPQETVSPKPASEATGTRRDWEEHDEHWTGPDTAPSGIRIGTPASGIPATESAPEKAPEEGRAEAPETSGPAAFTEIPPLLVDLSAPDLDLLEDERELLIPPQSVMPHVPTGVPRHHRSRRSI